MRRQKYVILIKDGKEFQAMPKRYWDECQSGKIRKLDRTSPIPEHDSIKIVMTTLGELLAQHTKKKDET